MLPAQIRVLAGATAAFFASSEAEAGGFLIRGESTTGLGAAFAGIAGHIGRRALNLGRGAWSRNLITKIGQVSLKRVPQSCALTISIPSLHTN